MIDTGTKPNGKWKKDSPKHSIRFIQTIKSK